MKRDYSISYVRLMAMIFIIICHILQYFNNELAWWFNVGVQIFLFISGFLYAKKKINSIKKFYQKEFIKILLPYYIYLFIIVIIYVIINNEYINYIKIIKSIFLIDTIKGLEHLWFIKYICICYFILPLLFKIFKTNKINCNSLFKLALIILFFEIISLLTKNYINGTWINCFVLGFFISQKDKNKLFIRIIFILSILFNFFEVYIKYIGNIKIVGIYNVLANKIFNIAHLLLAILLFFLLKMFYTKIVKRIEIKKALDWSDSYSYYIYITHHIYIRYLFCF